MLRYKKNTTISRPLHIVERRSVRAALCKRGFADRLVERLCEVKLIDFANAGRDKFDRRAHKRQRADDFTPANHAVGQSRKCCHVIWRAILQVQMPDEWTLNHELAFRLFVLEKCRLKK